jgi:hypothetical protein
MEVGTEKPEVSGLPCYFDENLRLTTMMYGIEKRFYPIFSSDECYLKKYQIPIWDSSPLPPILSPLALRHPDGRPAALASDRSLSAA